MANGYQFILPEQVSETQHKYTHTVTQVLSGDVSEEHDFALWLGF